MSLAARNTTSYSHRCDYVKWAANCRDGWNVQLHAPLKQDRHHGTLGELVWNGEPHRVPKWAFATGAGGSYRYSLRQLQQSSRKVSDPGGVIGLRSALCSPGTSIRAAYAKAQWINPKPPEGLSLIQCVYTAFNDHSWKQMSCLSILLMMEGGGPSLSSAMPAETFFFLLFKYK